MNKLLILSIPDGDWEGLYVNGELQQESHSIRIYDLIGYCPIESIKEETLDKFDPDEDCLPDKYVCKTDEQQL